jgi:hypothetical protein
MPTPDETDPTLDDGGKETTPPSSPQPENWEKRYKGLQVAYDKLQKKYDALDASHNQVMVELEEERLKTKTHDTDKKSLSDALAKAEADKTALQGQLSSHSIERERTKLILSEFADLAGFEADGLLPTAATIEELKPKLEAFRTRVGGLATDEAKRKIAGTVPTGGGNNPPPTRSKEFVYAELNRLAGSQNPKDREKYKELIDEWDELNK